MRFRSNKSLCALHSVRAVSLTTLDVLEPRTGHAFLIWRRTLRRATRLRPHAVLACTPLLLCLLPTTALAQQRAAGLQISSSILPEEPRPQLGPQRSADGSASVSGVVLDISGASVPGAQVSLTDMGGAQQRTLLSGAHGEFAFTRLPPGSYLVIVHAKGLEPFTSAEFDITAQQAYELPRILLPVATASTEITVRPTEVIAAEQIKAEEKQRLLGIIPNFYVSYVHDPVPLTTKQKYSLASHDTLDWTSFVGISVTAGIEQANNSFAGYGQGAAGYGKRWAAEFGNGRSSDYLSNAVFPSIFHQDPRYFYQGTGTKKSRLYHAVSSAFVTRSDSGNTMPNYSYLLGAMCSGALSNAYYPHADRGLNLVFTNAFVGIAGRAGGNVLQEFLGKRLTKNSAASANEKP
jgi:Carboxypeptidase regulatory-like domain